MATEPTTDSRPAWSARSRKRSLRAAEERSLRNSTALVTAARELLASGEAEFTVQQIADRAGLSLRTFYAYFETKDDLLLAVIEEVTSDGAGLALKRAERFDDPVDRVVAILDSTLSYSTSRPGEALLSSREHLRLAALRSEADEAALAPLLNLLEAELAAGMATGRIRAGNAKALSHMLASLMTMQVHAILVHGGSSEVATPAEIVDFCRRALENPDS